MWTGNQPKTIKEMKTTNSIIVIATTLTIGLASSLSATPRSKQISPPTSQQREASSQPSGSSTNDGHLKAGPRSKRIGG